jgi:transcription-repair coupling factor (superfamily II helicase)
MGPCFAYQALKERLSVYLCTFSLTLWRFAKIQVEGKTQKEAIKLVYADNDIVYVSIHSLHKISNTTEKTERSQNLQIGVECLEDFKTKPRRVKHIAFNLIQLYAKRRLEKGSSLRQIVICKTNWKAHLYMKIRQTKPSLRQR